ncbi:MAG: phosphohistidine phosphatase SixA [Candidatus Neomarinimicrobiota bacterium]
MKLYLVQHGDALPKGVDPERGLSERGKQDVTHAAAVLAKGGVLVNRIWHSGKKRAEETALLLQSCLAPGGEFGETDGIAPLDPVDRVAAEIEDWREDAMLVGHLPFMAKLVSQLVVENESTALVAFQPGSVICLERREPGRWAINWMVRPELMSGRKETSI